MPDANGVPSPGELAEEDALVENPSLPEEVEPTLDSPAPVEDVDQETSEAQRGPDVQAADAPSDVVVLLNGEPLPEFDDRVKEQFEGLLFLGHLTREFGWGGHRFVIRTIKIDETLEVGLIVKEYAGSIGEMKAYQAAMCAACVLSVDGTGLPTPLTRDAADTPMRNAFNYIVHNWYPATLDAVYQEFLHLEEIVMLVLKAMADAAPLAPGVTVPATGTAT